MSHPLTSAKRKALNVFHDLHLRHVRKEQCAPERSLPGAGRKAAGADTSWVDTSEKAVVHPTAHAVKLTGSR